MQAGLKIIYARICFAGTDGFSVLQKLAGNYNGQKYDLDNPTDRIQMKRRLLRMFHPKRAFIIKNLTVLGIYFADTLARISN